MYENEIRMEWRKSARHLHKFWRIHPRARTHTHTHRDRFLTWLKQNKQTNLQHRSCHRAFMMCVSKDASARARQRTHNCISVYLSFYTHFGRFSSNFHSFIQSFIYSFFPIGWYCCCCTFFVCCRSLSELNILCNVRSIVYVLFAWPLTQTFSLIECQCVLFSLRPFFSSTIWNKVRFLFSFAKLTALHTMHRCPNNSIYVQSSNIN